MGSAWAAFPGANGMIAFTTDRGYGVNDDEIYVMNADGSGQTRLTFNSASDWLPSWSPDGSKIAFQSGRDESFEIYVMNADGSQQSRITFNAAADEDPAWSPDGSKMGVCAGAGP